jgi:HD superfamily phosphodiesterase
VNPTPEQISTGLQALRDEATSWVGLADTMTAGAGKARAVGLPPAAFSFAGQAVAAAYEALRVKTADLLDAGAANFDDIAAALRASAAAYEADEAAHAHRLNNIY